MSRAASHVFLAPCHLSLIGMFCLIQLFDYSEAALWHDVCEPKDYGTTRTEENYECRSEEILCTKAETTCSCSGMEMGWSGTDYYNTRGDRLNSVGGGGWDCAHKCWRKPVGFTSGQTSSSIESCNSGNTGAAPGQCTKNEDPSK